MNYGTWEIESRWYFEDLAELRVRQLQDLAPNYKTRIMVGDGRARPFRVEMLKIHAS